MPPTYPVTLPDRNSHAYPKWAYFISLLSETFGLERFQGAIEGFYCCGELRILVDDGGEATAAHQVDAVQQHRLSQGVDRSATGHEPLHIGALNGLFHAFEEQNLEDRCFPEDNSSNAALFEYIPQGLTELFASLVGLFGDTALGH